MFVKPAKKGLVVRDPGDKYRIIPESGKEVKKNAYWLRRLRDGDVVLSAKESEKSEAPKPSKKKQKKKSEISEQQPLTSKGDE